MADSTTRRVRGIGGIFFKARDPEALRDWYRRHLGIDVQSWGGAAFRWHQPEAPEPDGSTVWSVFSQSSDYFDPSAAPFMINYRVKDLAAVLAALRAEGCAVDDKSESSEFGKFGWVMDPEGNRIELWEPPAGPPALTLLVNIDVDDLEKAVAFYERGLGLRPGRRLGPDGREMLGASAPIYLLQVAPGSAPHLGAESRRHYGRHWTPVHFDVAVPDLQAAVDRALAAGAGLEGEIVDRAWGRMARMADPFGHGFCILQFKGRGYDEIA